MKGKELIKLLQKQGWINTNTEGSHYKMFNPETGKTVIIPRHDSKEMGAGLLNKIMKQAGLK